MVGRVLLLCVAAVVVANGAGADDVVGAIWKVERQDNKEIVWTFRAGPKGGVWSVPKEGKPELIGTWTGGSGKTVIKIDAADKRKHGPKRTITIVQVGKNPPKWQGEVELSDGRKAPLTVTLVKD